MSCSNNEFLLREVEEWDGQFTRVDSYLAAGLLSNGCFILGLPVHIIQVLLQLLTPNLAQGTTSPSVGSSPSKKDATSQPQTPLEKLLSNAGPIRKDGSDKFFGMENVRLSARALQ